MCRLFGMSAGEAPVQASFWLLDAPDSLVRQSHREPDGTGLGWFDEHGKPHVSKQALAAYEDRRFAREARELRSQRFLAHIRFASTGALELRNTHPFKQRGRLFAHNGVIRDLPRLEQQLGEDRRLVGGDTDSERLFALITREISAHGEDVLAGIREACTWVAGNLPLFAINFLLADAWGMWALRYPETHPLYMLEHEPGETVAHTSSLGMRVHVHADATPRSIVLASERLDTDPRWRELASGELVHIDGQLAVQSHRLLESPPAHPLTLADLDAHARASQTAHLARA